MERQLQKDITFLAIAEELSKLSTCIDKMVGCVLTDGVGRIIGTGYNGAPRGHKHCTELNVCDKDFGEVCRSAHAEQNALLQCKDTDLIATCYCTLSPCVVCLKMLLNTPCYRIVFIHEHKHVEPREFWLSKERIWLDYGYHFKRTV